MSSQLLNSFEAFAVFGASKQNLSTAVTMDNARFAKMTRDCKIVGKTVTSVDVDIIFKKVLVKGERRINFDQFQQSLRLLAQKKYGNDGEGLQKIVEVVNSSSPASNGTQPDASGIYSKLTDTSLYTGSHKQRFDSDGKGRGLDGRDSTAATSLSQMVSRKGGVSNKELNTIASKRAESKSKNNLKSSQALSASSSNNYDSKSAQNLSVYDRLNDSKSFTGTHKHRFDENGKGRGLAGRDSQGSEVHSLSQILRNS